MFFLSFIALLGLASIALWINALFGIIQHEFENSDWKTVWLIAMFVFPVFAVIGYYVLIRSKANSDYVQEPTPSDEEIEDDSLELKDLDWREPILKDLQREYNTRDFV